MKRFKKMMAIAIVAVMTMMYTVPSMAATLKIQNTVEGYTYQPYQIFAGTASTGTEADQNGNNNPLQLNGVTWGSAMNATNQASFVAELQDEGIIPSGTYVTAGDVAVAIHDANITNDSEKAQKLAEIAKKYATVPAQNAKTVASGATQVEFTELPDGYYLIVNTAKPADTDETKYEMSDLMLDIVGNATVNSKQSSTPVVEKKIDTGATAGAIDSSDVDENTASIGDVVPYVIEGTLPATYARYKTYYYSFEDTLDTGLTYLDADDTSTTAKEAALKVYIVNGENAVDVTNKVTSTVGSITASTSSQDIKVTFNDLKTFDAGDNDVTIDKDTIIRVVYFAKVNTSASVVATDPNTNTVKVKYSNDPNIAGSGTPGTSTNPTGETPEDTVDTYVTDIQLKKTDGSKTLEGAQFTITGDGVKTVVTSGVKFVENANADPAYYQLSDDSYTTTAPTTETASKYKSTTTKYEKQTFTDTAITKGTDVDVTGFVGTTGLLNFKGLNAGVYKIHEDVAPNGYNAIEDFYVKVSFDSTTHTWSADACDQNGNLLTAPNAAHYTVDSNGVIEIEVVNQSGAELPSTGGIGTTLFYLIGAILVIGAGVILVTRRRVEGQQ